MAAALDAEAVLFGNGHAAAFFREHWGTSWAKRRAPTKLSELFTLDELAAHAFSPIAPGSGGDTLGFRAAYFDQQGRGRAFGAPLELARQMLDAGMTLSFDHLQRSHPKLGALASAVGQLVGAVEQVTVNCFLSPDESGFPWHIDCTHGLILQISGEKRWLLGPRVPEPPFHLQQDAPTTPAVAEMLTALGYPVPGPDAAPPQEVVLEPDDILYLPPGVWHRPVARGTSCHLSLVVRPFSFARVVRASLAAMALLHTDWRTDMQRLGVADAPAAPPARGELVQYLAAQLDALRRELARMTPERLATTMQSLAASPVLRDVLLDRAARDVL